MGLWVKAVILLSLVVTVVAEIMHLHWPWRSGCHFDYLSSGVLSFLVSLHVAAASYFSTVHLCLVLLLLHPSPLGFSKGLLESGFNLPLKLHFPTSSSLFFN